MKPGVDAAAGLGHYGPTRPSDTTLLSYVGTNKLFRVCSGHVRSKRDVN